MLEIDLKPNLPDFSKQLARFSSDFQKRAVRSATKAGGNVLKKFAIKFAPELQKPDTRKKNPRVAGDLKRAIYSGRSKRKSSYGVEDVQVSFRAALQTTRAGKIKGGALYGRFLEAGWLPRGPGQKIRGGKHSRALARSRSLSGGAKSVTKYKFLAPAFNIGHTAALDAFEIRIEKRIAEENAKR